MTITTKELTQPKLKKAGLISFLLFLVCLFVLFFFFSVLLFAKIAMILRSERSVKHMISKGKVSCGML